MIITSVLVVLDNLKRLCGWTTCSINCTSIELDFHRYQKPKHIKALSWTVMVRYGILPSFISQLFTFRIVDSCTQTYPPSPALVTAELQVTEEYRRAMLAIATSLFDLLHHLAVLGPATRTVQRAYRSHMGRGFLALSRHQVSSKTRRACMLGFPTTCVYSQNIALVSPLLSPRTILSARLDTPTCFMQIFHMIKRRCGGSADCAQSCEAHFIC